MNRRGQILLGLLTLVSGSLTGWLAIDAALVDVVGTSHVDLLAGLVSTLVVLNLTVTINMKDSIPLQLGKLRESVIDDCNLAIVRSEQALNQRMDDLLASPRFDRREIPRVD